MGPTKAGSWACINTPEASTNTGMGKRSVISLDFPQLSWGEEGPSGGSCEGAAPGCWRAPLRTPYRTQALVLPETT